MAKRILILFSDSGGGHRSAGQAIHEALIMYHGADVAVTMVDALTEYAPFPFNRLPAWYPTMIRCGSGIWEHGFRLTDGPQGSRAIISLAWPLVSRAAARFVYDHPADVIVSVHPMLVDTIVRSLGCSHPPFVTVVTDLISTHALWYHPTVDLCIVPTETARQHALRCGLPPEKVRVVGLPVAASFSSPSEDKAALRARLGWSQDCPVIMIVGGGEGMGPVAEIVRAVSSARLGCELVVITGRNESLYRQLSAVRWDAPTHIYGFVTEIMNFMRAADVLVSKAGPGTISEALNANLPMILYRYIPGQETGNVSYITEAGAGVWAPRPQQVVDTLRRWIGPDADPQALSRMAANAQRLAKPNAAREIAETIWEMAHQSGERP